MPSFGAVRGCVELPVEGESEPFIWGVWVDLSKQTRHFDSALRVAKRKHMGPFAGYLTKGLPIPIRIPLSIGTPFTCVTVAFGDLRVMHGK